MRSSKMMYPHGFSRTREVQHMGAVIQARILGLDGQVIKGVAFKEQTGRVGIVGDIDLRRRPVDRRTGRRGGVHRLLRRTVLDVPLGGTAAKLRSSTWKLSLPR